jgi:hypothetical protein
MICRENPETRDKPQCIFSCFRAVDAAFLRWAIGEPNRRHHRRTGFIGRHVGRPDARGYRRPRTVRPDRRTTRRRRRGDPGATRRGRVDAFAGADTVVSRVARAPATAYSAVNVEGTRAVARAAHAAAARLVHVSSLAAAGPASAASPRREDDPPSPRTPYGCSKLEGEQVVTGTHGLRWIILRPGVVYGPGDRALFQMGTVIETAVALFGCFKADVPTSFANREIEMGELEAAGAKACSSAISRVTAGEILDGFVWWSAAPDGIRPAGDHAPRRCGCDLVARMVDAPCLSPDGARRVVNRRICLQGGRLRERLGIAEPDSRWFSGRRVVSLRRVTSGPCGCGLSTLKKDQIAERGARPQGATTGMREYLRESNAAAGCSAREVVLQRGQATRP